MQQLNINPELQRLIPPLTQEEFSQLTANVLAEGIREPIITWNGTIVDGHNRYQIAQEHGLEYDTSEMYFKSLDECKEWMILNQFGRRNLSNYQRSVLALELEQVFRDKARANQSIQFKGSSLRENLPEVKPMRTREELAKVANVSDRTIDKVKVIEAKANDKIKEQLRSGEVSINKIYQTIIKEEKKANAEITQRDEILIEKLKNGETIVVNQTTDLATIKYAEDNDLYVRADRYSDWGNPFEMGKDGDRNEVCFNYETHYLPYKPSLLNKINNLKGKALGCWCSPEKCHCDSLINLIK